MSTVLMFDAGVNNPASQHPITFSALTLLTGWSGDRKGILPFGNLYHSQRFCSQINGESKSRGNWLPQT